MTVAVLTPARSFWCRIGLHAWRFMRCRVEERPFRIWFDWICVRCGREKTREH